MKKSPIPISKDSKSTPSTGLGSNLAGPIGMNHVLSHWASRSISSHTIQPKLAIAPQTDPFERQADAIASAAIHPDSSPASLVTSPLVQQQPSILRKAADKEVLTSSEKGTPEFTKGGLPMPVPLLHDMERSIGADFSQVRVHTDATAAKHSQDLGAKAFTYGNHIHFNHSQFSPQTQQGRFLIAHELTHTLQQSQAPAIQRAPDPLAQAPAQDPIEDACRAALAGDPGGMSLLCAKGPNDPLLEALNAAYQGTNSKWAKSMLLKIEPSLIAIRNVFEGPFDRNLQINDPGFPDTYLPLKLDGKIMRGLKQLYTALHETHDLKAMQILMNKAKSAFSGPLGQLSRFLKDKTFGSLDGFQQLSHAVETGIQNKFKGLDIIFDIAQQKFPKPAAKKKASAGEGMPRGYNRKKMEPASLPGLGVDPAAAAPAEGSLAAQVEANMQRDLVAQNGGEEDFLYLNIPAIISGKARSDTAMKMWDIIRAYRSENSISTLFGAYITHPNDPAAKQAYDVAMAKMEQEIGPEVRALAISLWTLDIAQVSTIIADANTVGTTLQKTIDGIALPEGSTSTLDSKALKAAAAAFKTSIEGILDYKDTLGLSDPEIASLKELDSALAKAIAALVKLAGKKLSPKEVINGTTQLTEANTNLGQAIEQATTNLPGVQTKHEALQAKMKPILDRLQGPNQLPLLTPVKRHDVAVTFKGGLPEDEATAYFATEPESRIGIYQNVWSPTGIKDKSGYFERPESGERGKMVYEELKSKHGFTESEAKIFASVSCGEGDFHSLNSVDVMRISLGFIQFAGTSFADLLEELQQQNPAFFETHFAQYGIRIDDPKAPKIPTVQRHQRFVPGADVSHPREDGQPTNLVVYDHHARQWVRGLEAMAVLQSDPRYLTLIRTSGKHPEMQIAQVKRAMNSYHKITRTAGINYREVGLDAPNGDKKAAFQAREVLKNEMAAYAATATSIGGGNGSGIALERQLIKTVVATYKVKTLAELQAIPQADIVAILKKQYDKWKRPDLFAKASGNPLSDTNYDGMY